MKGPTLADQARLARFRLSIAATMAATSFAAAAATCWFECPPYQVACCSAPVLGACVAAQTHLMSQRLATAWQRGLAALMTLAVYSAVGVAMYLIFVAVMIVVAEACRHECLPCLLTAAALAVVALQVVNTIRAVLAANWRSSA